MKTVKFLCAAALAALTALVSCNKEKEEPVIVPDPELTSFKFEFAKNQEAISSDIEGVISGDAVSVSMMKTADKSRLVATFTANEGNVVKVGDVVQVSGETANDFTNPVDYIVTNSDGSKSALYSVSIKTVNGKLELLATYSERPVYSGAVLRVNPVDKAPYIGFKEKSASDSESASAEKMTVVKYADGAWSAVGSAGFSKKVSGSEYDFDITEDGSFYVAYANAESSTKNVQVMTYSNNKWEVVGKDETSDIQSQKVTLSAISDKNIIVLQTNNNRKHELGRYTLVASIYDGSWNSAPTVPFEKNPCVNIAGDKAGNTAYFLVIRKSFEGVNYGHDVVAYTNGNWSSLRTNYVRKGATQTDNNIYDITATDDGTVYIVTADNASDGSTYHFVVEKYNQASKDWSVIGGTFYPFVHAESHNRAKIAVAPDGTPYLLYYDYLNKTLRLTWFDSGTKQWAEPLVVATEAITDPCIAFASSGVGYIAFTDENNAEKVFIYR